MSELIQNLEQKFANLIRSYRKHQIGKGPDKIRITFTKNWVIAHMSGCLSSVEKFIIRSEEGRNMIWQARTRMIKDLYSELSPNEMEEIVGAKFVKFFTDVDFENDEVVSIFVFDQPIDGTDKMFSI
ncbi:Na-translocating system protein MpsC family protein [Cytobacillus kochii]